MYAYFLSYSLKDSGGKTLDFIYQLIAELLLATSRGLLTKQMASSVPKKPTTHLLFPEMLT